MPTPEQKERLNALTALFTSYRFPEVVEAWRQIQHYLEKDNTPLPAYHHSHLEHFIYELARLLKAPSQWDKFDQKVFALLEQVWRKAPPQWHNPKLVLATAWAKNIWEEHTDLKTFEEVLGVLTKYGLKQQDIWEHLEAGFILE
ncbi:MAG: hypothetical protein IT259_00595, partial [Saprospiraceae bacterium]|nr:hypothetical protein [Saprospiraceae bacterium]